MTERPTVLLAMITVGQGHKTAADALAAHLERSAPGRFDLRVLDFTAAVGDAAFDRRHKASWDAMLAYPWSAYWGQRLLDRVVPVGATRAVTRLMLTDHARHAAAYVLALRPALVVATHFFTLRALGIARRTFGLDVPVVGLNPDPLDAHALWLEPAADEMIVFSPQARRDLTKRGMPAEKVSVFPYLMRPDVPHPGSARDARLALGLDPDRFTVLHSAGGQGIGGRLEASVDAVLALDPDVQYVVVCGRNERLRERLAARGEAHRGRARLVARGFVTDIPRHLRAADVVVGKAGPASTFEALISGCPVLHTSFAAANEKAVLDACLAWGVSAYLPSPERLARRVAVLAEDASGDGSELAAWRARVEALELRNGGGALAEHLLERYLRRSTGA